MNPFLGPFGEVVGDVPTGCEVGWGVVGSDAAFIVAKDHVHDPVQGVLDGPCARIMGPTAEAGITSEVM